MECDSTLRLVYYAANDTIFSKLDQHHLDLDETATPEKTYRQFQKANRFVYHNILPTLLGLGMLGGLLTVAALARWWKGQRQKKELTGKGAIIGLILLAVIDILFCSAGLLEYFFQPHVSIYSGGSTVPMVASYFMAYDRAIFNCLVFISAWQLALLCVKPRYSPRCPAVVCLASLLFCIPMFLEWRVDEADCMLRRCYTIVMGSSSYIQKMYVHAWCSVGYLALLIQVSRAVLTPFTIDRREISVTTTVVRTLFLLLVGPAMLLTLIGAQFREREWSDTHFYRMRVAGVIFGWTQAVFFSLKFPLYCLLSPEFHEMLKMTICHKNVGSKDYMYKPLI